MKAYNDKISKEELLQMSKEHTEIGNQYAKSKGFKNIKEMTNVIKSQLQDDSMVVKQAGERLAGHTIYDLALLVLYQEVVGPRDASYLDFAEMFNDGYIKQGNSKSYVYNFITGNGNYDKTKFVPEQATEQVVKQHIISMYMKNQQGQEQLAPNTVRYKKPLTLLTPNWTQYFTNNALNDFLTSLRINMRKSFKMFKFDKVARFLTGLQNVKTINGQAQNMFDCFTEEIFPEIEKMDFYSKDYNRDQTFKGIECAGANNVYMIAHSTIISKMRTGIKSQTFHYKLLDVKNLLDSRVISLGNQFTIGDENTPVDVGATPYVDENTIWVFNKDLIKVLYQVNTSSTQSFAENLATQIVLHVWLTMDTLPWGQVFKYTNTNLRILPGNETQTTLLDMEDTK